MDNVVVSVICLTYNHEKYLSKALEGFIKQKTDFNYEVLIHDDASDDKTKEIIERYTNDYPEIIKPIIQDTNQFSKGIDIISEFVYPKIKGKYIAICDGDDYWIDCNKLQKQYNALERENDCSLSVHRVRCVNEDDSYNDKTHPSSKYGISVSGKLNQDVFSSLLFKKGSYPFQTSSYFLKKDVMKTSIDLFKTTQDVYLLYSALALGNVFYFEEAMSIRRMDTIGNWNSIERKKGIEGSIQRTYSLINNLMLFNKYTESKFNDDVMYAVYNGIIDIQKKSKKKAHMIFKEKKCNLFDMIKYIGCLETIKFILKSIW